MGDIIISKGVRYRAQDAKRLGLVADGKVVTKASEQVPPPAAPPAGDPVVVTDPAAPPAGDTAAATEPKPERPAGNGSKADWLAYAIASGVAEADLADKTRDDIAALFATA